MPSRVNKSRLFFFCILRQNILLFIFLIFFSAWLNNQLFAAGFRDIVLEADYISYGNVSKNVLASGNANVIVRGYNVSTDQIIFNFKKKKLRIPGDFVIKKKLQNIDAKDFTYDFNIYEGEASSVNAQIERLHIVGTKLVFMPDKLLLEQASFTTCDKDHPHYEVKADQLYIYPQWGFFVAFNNFVRANFLPIQLWVPTYVYGAASYGLIGSSTPIPVIGSNQKEGMYIKHKFGYYHNEKSSGTIDVGLTEKLGYLVGGSHSLIIDQFQAINVRGHYIEKDDFEGRFAYMVDVIKGKDSLVDEENIIENMFSKFSLPLDLPRTRFSVILQHREIDIDSRVSYMPDINLDISNYQFAKLVDLDLTCKLGRVEEETATGNYYESNRLNIDASLRKDFYVTDYGKMDVRVYGSGFWYSGNRKWQRLFTSLGWSWEEAFLKPRISYSKKIINNGSSPFEFESKYAMQTDELGAHFAQEIGSLELLMDADYSLEEHKLRNFDMTVIFPFHCWRGSFTWKGMQGYMQFGFDIY
jgi:hypothetical protein